MVLTLTVWSKVFLSFDHCKLNRWAAFCWLDLACCSSVNMASWLVQLSTDSKQWQCVLCLATGTTHMAWWVVGILFSKAELQPTGRVSEGKQSVSRVRLWYCKMLFLLYNSYLMSVFLLQHLSLVFLFIEDWTLKVVLMSVLLCLTLLPVTTI